MDAWIVVESHPPSSDSSSPNITHTITLHNHRFATYNSVFIAFYTTMSSSTQTSSTTTTPSSSTTQTLYPTLRERYLRNSKLILRSRLHFHKTTFVDSTPSTVQPHKDNLPRRKYSGASDTSRRSFSVEEESDDEDDCDTSH
ncbi:hypothetical protein BD410DRAFT_844002 [Rickenella mellea]|uniref:Uncharacterized protein n=1 Tax=Rickenella mellea TaxID=50990 RepID=A0A4Y7PNY3_9AGAM|nr:hypothetical protein BD410DRAFT_844002 [Rickenella mellea]